ncbi:hypothetical protein [Pseudomonas saxonica]|uniref:hypothetical protein n=1 Tax=Pseudomonas saxonica TaxID=2600598 RepID=UPI002D787D53|nr:hypothetical protein [Pseudomonas saxonica]WRQ75752.1 hypothetical protein VQY67_03595 [Pseudomonas saxonica]
MKHIKLMADYDCHPLWNMTSEKYGDISPDELPISKKLQSRLLEWAAKYNDTLNRENPAHSGFASEEQEYEFKKEGALIADLLQTELGPDYIVTSQI